LLFSTFFMMVRIPDFSYHLLGFRAWIPLCITLILCLMIKPSEESPDTIHTYFRILRPCPYLFGKLCVLELRYP
jgi:hypothetical protein